MYTFDRLKRRLLEKANDARARAVTYVAFGDSVTQGCMEEGVVEYENVYHQVIKRGMERRYPSTVVNVINSGVSGDTIVASRPRWERDVLMYKPDLVTICFGHNDAHGRQEGLPAFVQSISEIVARIREETEAEILIMTPCMMMKRANSQIKEVHKPLIPSNMKLAEDGILELYVEAIRELAEELKIPLFDSYTMWEQMEQGLIDIHSRLSNGINHPTPEFHIAWGEALETRLFI